MVENVGVAVGIMSVCCWKPKLHRPAENRRFFHGGCSWFSTSFQVVERAIFTRRTPEHPELDPVGTGFDRILKFTRVAKIFEKNMGVKICTPPAVRGLSVGHVWVILGQVLVTYGSVMGHLWLMRRPKCTSAVGYNYIVQ